ncbi:MAG: hypothetical protein ACR2P3_11445 [Geminicoccaceae bacterium]
MAEWKWLKPVPLALVALLFLGGCEDEPEKKKILEVEVEKGTEVRVRIKKDEVDEMIIVAELAVFATLVIWALFGPGATRRRDTGPSENR